MKKTLAALLAITLAFSLVGCSAKKITRDEEGNIIEAEPKQKTYAEMSFEEKLEYMDKLEKEPTTITNDCGMVAPACFKGAPEYGYINNLGDWFIAPMYSAAYSYNEGIAPILDQYLDYEYINNEGELIKLNLPKKATLKAIRHFYDGYAAIVIDNGFEQNKEYISSDGLSVINADGFPTVKNTKYSSKEYFSIATPFKNGRAVVMRKTNASLLNANTLEQIEKKKLFESAYVINQSGEIVATLPAGYDVTDYGLCANESIIVRDMTKEDEHYGVVNMDGTILLPCIYHDIEYFEDDLYLAQNGDGFFGFVAPTSITKIDFKFEAAYPFANGYAAVKENDLWGIIDKDGHYVIEPKFDNIERLVLSDMDVNINGAAVVDDIFVAQYGAYWGMFNLKGEIIDAIYAPNAGCPYYSESEGLFIAYKEYNNGIASGMSGLLDLTGKEVLPPEYTYIGSFRE